MGEATNSTAGAADARPPGASRWLAFAYLAPALAMLALFIGYPVVYSAVRSLYDDAGSRFVGMDNYGRVLTDPLTLTAIKNTAVWVIVAPTVVCALGLVFAVLAERVRWAAAFRLVLFMPMAISLFASGVIFRLVYEEEPERGLVNAVVVSVHGLVSEPAPYWEARPGEPTALARTDGGLVTAAASGRGDVVALSLVGTRPPDQALAAAVPAPAAGELRGVVWFDGLPRPAVPGVVDTGERGFPLITVEALAGDRVVATATTGDDGSFTFPDLAAGDYRLRLPESNFAAPFRGHTWLGPGLITPVIISCWVWVMAGFAMTFIAAGLAAIPPEVLEAARVDGATEAQILRRIIVRLLSPVLLVVLVTLVIAVLKVFELVFVMAPGSVQDEANVLAMEIWRVSFGPGLEYGFGSALCIVLFLLMIPAMLFHIRRLTKDSQ